MSPEMMSWVNSLSEEEFQHFLTVQFGFGNYQEHSYDSDPEYESDESISGLDILSREEVDYSIAITPSVRINSSSIPIVITPATPVSTPPVSPPHTYDQTKLMPIPQALIKTTKKEENIINVRCRNCTLEGHISHTCTYGRIPRWHLVQEYAKYIYFHTSQKVTICTGCGRPDHIKRNCTFGFKRRSDFLHNLYVVCTSIYKLVPPKPVTVQSSVVSSIPQVTKPKVAPVLKKETPKIPVNRFEVLPVEQVSDHRETTEVPAKTNNRVKEDTPSIKMYFRCGQPKQVNCHMTIKSARAKGKHSFDVPIVLRDIETQKSCPTDALLDSGAYNCFMDETFATSCKLKKRKT